MKRAQTEAKINPNALSFPERQLDRPWQQTKWYRIPVTK